MRALVLTILLLPAADLWGADALAQRSEISAGEVAELRGLRARVDGKIRELNATKRSIDVKQGELNSTRQSMARLQADNDRARARLKQLRDVEDTNPDAIQPATMAAAVNENRETYSRLSAAKTRIGKLEAEVLDLRGTTNGKSAELEQLRRSYENALDAAAERQVTERIRGMQVKKTASATVTTSCGENMGLADCRHKSQKDAESKIAETGSVVMVESLTEVRNFKLTKEELRSQVSAQLSDVRVQQKPTMNPDTGHITVQTQITASVTPAISPAFRDQLKASVRSEVVARAGGALDFSALGVAAIEPTSPAGMPDDAAARRDDQQRRLEEEQRRQAQQRRLEDERRQLEAERALLAERRRREEAERAEQERRDREAAEAAARRRRGTYTPTF